MNKKLNLLFICFICIVQITIAQNQKPVLTNIRLVSVGSDTMRIYYNLDDNENDTMEIFLSAQVVQDGRYLNTTNAIGAIGKNQLPGSDKMIEWSGYNSQFFNENIRITITADDHKGLNILDIIADVDSNRMIRDMDTLVGTRHYIQAPQRLQQIKDTLIARFTSNNLSLGVQSFQYQNYQAQNIIGTHQGKGIPNESIIIDGHFDCVSNGPGADDNLSAVVAVLEAARILSKYDLNRTVQFIGFDLEELGLLGSKEYVKNGRTAGESLKGVLNFEMIGYYSEKNGSQKLPTGFNQLFPTAYAEVVADTFKGNFITNVGNVASSALVDQFVSSSNTYVPELRVISVKAPGTSTIAPDLRRSDHAPFWDAGLPAVMLTDGANFRNKNYHTALDVADSLNFGFISNVVKATIATTLQMAQIANATQASVDTFILNGVGIQSANKRAYQLLVSPNPAKESVKAQWDISFNAKEVQIFDIKGSLMYCSAVKGNSHYLHTEVFPAGTYMVKLIGEEGELNTRLVLK